jgi:hypothetical protein
MTMMSKEDLARIREEHEVMDNWRLFARHVVAELLEACAICGTVRDKEHLARCRWCEDVYYCKEGTCSHQHHVDVHPAVAFWTW